jgi:16S rRNA (cytosine967-C5)-methyltransferase
MTDSLQPRKAALSILHRIRGGEDSDAALDAVLNASSMERRDKAFVMALALGTLRYGKVADVVLAKAMQKPVDEKKAAYVADALRMGVVQLLWLGVPPHATVHSSVELVKHSKFRGFSKLVNGVLQRINRESKTVLDGLDVAQLATPPWLFERWQKAYGNDTARVIASANLQEPMLDITAKTDPNHWAQTLGGEVLLGNTVRLNENAVVPELAGYADGSWWVQDVAAAIPARLLANVRGKRVLDVCAAPGGKTMQLAQAGAEVVALDRSAKRLQRLQQNMQRVQLPVKTVAADALSWQPDELFDAILVDAPCTSTGTLRRHPDIAWRKSPKDVLDLASLQRELLHKAVEWLKPQGMLVYSTCSLEKEEGEDHIAAIVNEQLAISPVTADELGGLAELVTPEGYVRCLPHYLQDKGGMDGFFAARFIKM